MQSTHKVPGSSATTWSKYLVSEASRGDYYTHDGDGNRAAPTQWHGPAELLRSYGIDPGKAVELKHLRPLMHGFDPVSKEPIRPAGADKTRVAAIDLSYGAPKDVSALWATSSPYRRAQLEVAHKRAVKSALERTEREVPVVRRKTDNVQRFERAKRLLAPEALHTTSRLAKDQEAGAIPDPQLHSHVAVIAAERKDGVIAAVESRQLMLAAREGGAWYRAELAQNLKELGVDIERRTGNGERYFGVRGVPEDLSEHWSKRSQDVERAAQTFRRRYGREPGPGELDSLTLSTRGSKSAAAPAEINAAWRALGEEHGLTSERSEELFHCRSLRNKAVDLREELIAEVTKDRATIDTHELKAKAYELSAGVCRPAEADELVGELTRSGELLRLEDGTWTTRRHRELEQSTIDIAQRRATEIAAPVRRQSLEQAEREMERQLAAPLLREQRDALRTITGPGGMALLVGWAGTGKNVVISTAARAWQLDGYEVTGTAIAGRRAQELGDDAKLDSVYNADQLINGVQRGNIRLGPKTVVVMDEAAMSDTIREAKLAKLADRAHSKYLGVGDSAQLSSIGAGGLFPLLQDKVPTAELKHVHRARHEWERTAWAQIRNGEPQPALAAYKAHDRLHIHDTRAQAAQAMVDHWNEIRSSLPDGQAVMITDSSNADRDTLNAMAQERRAQAGELAAHQVDLPHKPYGLRAGDPVIFTAKFPVPGEERIENGITGTVIDTSPDQDEVTIRTDEKEAREINVNAAEFPHLSLAYAVHLRKAQGITAEMSGVMIGGWQTDKEHAYVAVSRSREETQIYVSREDLGERGMDTGAIERLAERMQRSRAQEASITRQLAEQTPQPPIPRTIDRQPRIEPSTRGRRRPIPQPQLSKREIGEMLEQDRKRRLEAEIDKYTHGQRMRQEALERGEEPDPVHERDHPVQLDDPYTNQANDPAHDLDRAEEADRDVYIQQAIQAERDRQQAWQRDTEPHINNDRQLDQPASIEPGERSIDQAKQDGRDPYIEQAIQEERDRQQAFEQDINYDRDNDRDMGFEIE